VLDKDICSSLRHIVAYNGLPVLEKYGFSRGMSTSNNALNVLCMHKTVGFCLNQ